MVEALVPSPGKAEGTKREAVMAVQILTCGNDLCSAKNRVDMDKVDNAYCGKCKYPMSMALELNQPEPEEVEYEGDDEEPEEDDIIDVDPEEDEEEEEEEDDSEDPDCKYPNIKVKLVGEDGNAFTLIGLVTRALKANKVPKAEIDQFKAEAMSGDYDHLLRTCMAWVTVL